MGLFDILKPKRTRVVIQPPRRRRDRASERQRAADKRRQKLLDAQTETELVELEIKRLELQKRRERLLAGGAENKGELETIVDMLDKIEKFKKKLGLASGNDGSSSGLQGAIRQFTNSSMAEEFGRAAGGAVAAAFGLAQPAAQGSPPQTARPAGGLAGPPPEPAAPATPADGAATGEHPMAADIRRYQTLFSNGTPTDAANTLILGAAIDKTAARLVDDALQLPATEESVGVALAQQIRDPSLASIRPLTEWLAEEPQFSRLVQVVGEIQRLKGVASPASQNGQTAF